MWLIKEETLLFKKITQKAFDINGDGKIDFQDFKAIFTGERYYKKSTLEQMSHRVKEIWTTNKHHFDVLAVNIKARQKTSRSFINKLLARHERKVEIVILRLLEQFNDKELEFYRDDFDFITKKIQSIDKNIAQLKANSILEGENKYISSIERFQVKKTELTSLQEKALSFFRERFEVYGIDLTDEHTRALVSRCDAHEHSQMISVFYLITSMVEQISLALNESQDDLDLSKKYYSIFIGLLEIQLLIQKNYFAKVDKIFLPNLIKIQSESSLLLKETEKLKKSANLSHIDSYDQNINSQKVTIEVANLYMDILKKERESIVKASNLVKQRHGLALNTLATVSITAELSSLIKKSDQMFLEVMDLQTPEFQVFHNQMMHDEFVKMSARIRGSN